MSVDAETLGRLITAGHESLRSDYAATTPQTDAIVAEAGDTMVASAGGRSEEVRRQRPGALPADQVHEVRRAMAHAAGRSGVRRS